MNLAWGAAVSRAFALETVALSARVSIPDPSFAMAVMAFESARTFSPYVRNAAGSGAIGLIQFMPSTAALLGTTIEALAAMTALEQLAYVEAYFTPWRGHLKNLGDVYGAVLWPGMIGKPDSYAVFTAGGYRPKLYLQNRGLDLNHDGEVTRAEVASKVAAALAEGLLPQNSVEV